MIPFKVSIFFIFKVAKKKKRERETQRFLNRREIKDGEQKELNFPSPQEHIKNPPSCGRILIETLLLTDSFSQKEFYLEIGGQTPGKPGLSESYIRSTRMNAEFHRIARRDKKAFSLSDQYREIEENNRIGNTRDLFN